MSFYWKQFLSAFRSLHFVIIELGANGFTNMCVAHNFVHHPTTTLPQRVSPHYSGFSLCLPAKLIQQQQQHDVCVRLKTNFLINITLSPNSSSIHPSVGINAVSSIPVWLLLLLMHEHFNPLFLSLARSRSLAPPWWWKNFHSSTLFT